MDRRTRMENFVIRKAKIGDVRAIQDLIMPYAREGRLLPRSLSELYSRIRDFFVCEDNGRIVGCCGLHIVWEDLAEITSLAVNKEFHGRGIGRSLVQACIEEAEELGIPRLFVLTYEEEFFRKLGFQIVDKNIFPQKIWVDCLKCPKFPECDEVALLFNVSAPQESS
ncbi:amino-acid N-acetyltransferase [Thermodesulforhabdus norvegica]|uniref:Amino-acid N-acetyltransferase n=2 Tax=Thermodesulforhabdus norvegica TaxID=39841 RepID=A0A1I4RHW8_9BACT|nr:amino-acid N-acetyltransferase [Thermodesulforhabdus norvegica]